MYKSWENNGENLDEFVLKCTNLREKLELNNEDIRIRGLFQIEMVSLTIALIPIRFGQIIEIQNQDDMNILIEILGILPDLSPTDKQIFFENIDLNCRMSYITLFVFIIENLFNRILDEISTIKAQSTYQNAVKELILYSEITNLDYKNKVFRIMAVIRNSLHQSGLHNKSSEKFTINERDYEFIRNERVMWADWDNIFYVVTECVCILEEIFNSEKIRNIEFIDGSEAQ